MRKEGKGRKDGKEGGDDAICLNMNHLGGPIPATRLSCELIPNSYRRKLAYDKVLPF